MMEAGQLTTSTAPIAVVPQKSEAVPCTVCGRKFLPDRLPRHIQVCLKTKEKKRKPFDSRAKRKVDGDDVTTTANSSSSDLTSLANGSDNYSSQFLAKSGRWREAHEEFINTVRAAKKPVTKSSDRTSNGLKANAHQKSNGNVERPRSSQLTSDSPDDFVRKVPAGYIMCPTCDRSFARKAAERHIPWCAEKAKEKSFRPSTPSDPDKLAKLKARTSYKKGATSSNGSKLNGTHKQPIIKGRTMSGNGYTSSNGSTVPSTSALNGHAVMNRKSPPPTTRRTTDRNKNMTRHTQSVSPVKRTPGQTVGMNGNMMRRASPTMNTSGPESRVKAQLIANERKLLPKTPVVKFKDKFPHHAISGPTSKYMEDAGSLKELFKRPDTLANFPRTVPGVRTGGMTPTDGGQYENGTNGVNGEMDGKVINKLMANSLSIVKKSLENLYLNGDDSRSGPIPANHNIGHHSFSSSDLYVQGNGTNGHRGSTSGSSDGGQMVGGQSGSDRASCDSKSSSGKMPKWCHQCGTKYPLGAANYCYSCGARRLGTGSPFLVEPGNKSFS